MDTNKYQPYLGQYKGRRGVITVSAFLSIFVTVMLFIFGKHSFWKSLLIAAIALGAIWMMYFVIGQVINQAVSQELKKRGLKRIEKK